MNYNDSALAAPPEVRQTTFTISSELDDLIFAGECRDWSLAQQDAKRRDLMLASYRYHFEACALFRRYCENLGRDGSETEISDLPLFPTSVFKHAKVLSTAERDIENWYLSSGTNGPRSQVGRDRTSIERLLGSFQFGVGYVNQWYDYDLEIVNLGPDRFAAGNVWFQYVMSLVELMFPTHFTVQDDRLDPRLSVEHIQAVLDDGLDLGVVGPPFFILQLCQYIKAHDIRIEGATRAQVITGGGWKKHTGAAIPRDEFSALVMDAFGLEHPAQVRDVFNQVELNTAFFEDEQHRKRIPPWVHATALNPVDLSPLPDGEVGVMGYIDASAASYPAFIVSDDVGRVFSVTDEPGREGRCLEIIRRLDTRQQKGCALSMEQNYDS